MLGFKTLKLTPERRMALKEGDLLVYNDGMHHHGANLIEFMEDQTPERIDIPPAGLMLSHYFKPKEERDANPIPPKPVFLCRVYRRGDVGPAVEKQVEIGGNHRILVATKDEYLQAQKDRMQNRPTWKEANWRVWRLVVYDLGWHRPDARIWADKAQYPEGTEPGNQ